MTDTTTHIPGAAAIMKTSQVTPGSPERADERLDIALKRMKEHRKNPTVTDIFEVLGRMKEQRHTPDNLLQAYIDNDDLVAGRCFYLAIEDYYWELSLKDANKEMEK